MACDKDLGRREDLWWHGLTGSRKTFQGLLASCRLEDVFGETIWTSVSPFVYDSKDPSSGAGYLAQAIGACIMEASRMGTGCWNDYDGQGHCMIPWQQYVDISISMLIHRVSPG